MVEVEVQDPGRSSILTLMVKQILDRSLANPAKSGLMRNRLLTVRIQVRNMTTSLFFEASRVRAEDGAHGRPDIEISGDMRSLLSIALGANPVWALLRRHMRIQLRGWKGWVHGLRFLSLMRVDGRPKGAASSSIDRQPQGGGRAIEPPREVRHG
jgi:hypothetical protein